MEVDDTWLHQDERTEKRLEARDRGATTSQKASQVETTFRVPRATVALEFTVYDSSIRPDATPPAKSDSDKTERDSGSASTGSR